VRWLRQLVMSRSGRSAFRLRWLPVARGSVRTYSRSLGGPPSLAPGRSGVPSALTRPCSRSLGVPPSVVWWLGFRPWLPPVAGQLGFVGLGRRLAVAGVGTGFVPCSFGCRAGCGGRRVMLAADFRPRVPGVS